MDVSKDGRDVRRVAQEVLKVALLVGDDLLQDRERGRRPVIENRRGVGRRRLEYVLPLGDGVKGSRELYGANLQVRQAGSRRCHRCNSDNAGAD